MMGDGHLGKCKQCTKQDVAEREKRLRQDPVWLASERERCRNKQTVARLLGRAAKTTPEARERWQSRNPHKRRASNKVASAIKAGVIIKPKCCNRCGIESKRLEGHHEDYLKPLAVEWLCPACHGLTRRKDR